ncbi:hypothetical protein EJ04DRAFT_110285 [Polyplosphaeria fusca]|uniref:Secreted protein n=1 Tax=Polyplosphaeria fusca TaxID=682080 RepID=A0A9P4QKQ9_9PLEO|nr:hypothetical protein EJ04DRAFT_110285 [Polyplosphaeria fusca]
MARRWPGCTILFLLPLHIRAPKRAQICRFQVRHHCAPQSLSKSFSAGNRRSLVSWNRVSRFRRRCSSLPSHVHVAELGTSEWQARSTYHFD